jgi:hypothetical protein
MFTNFWQRIIELHRAGCASNRWPSASVLIDLARDENSKVRVVATDRKIMRDHITQLS